MKKEQLLRLMFIVCGFSIQAQPVLQSSDVMYDAEIVLQYLEYMEPGPEGEDVSWDFSDAVYTGVATGFNFTSPSASDSENYPDANVRLEWGSSARFYTHGEENTQSLGQYSTQVTVVYENPLIYHQFPMTYELEFTDEFSGVYTNNMTEETVTIDGDFYTKVDGYGTLVLPEGTIENVLRVKREYLNTQTSDAVSVTTKQTDYEWYHPNYPMAIFAMSRVTDVESGNVVSELGSMMQIDNLSIKEDMASVIQVYPNPADHQFFVNLDLRKETEVTIHVYDVLGREVYADKTIANGSPLKIDTSAWEKSSYIVRVQAEDKIWNKKISLL